VAERGSQLVLGLDPDPAELWLLPAGAEPSAGAPEEASAQAAGAVLRHCRALIDATAESCVAVKPQLARFEALGVEGAAVLRKVAAHARERGLLVIADGKRGDIDVTAAAYAGSLLGGIESPFGHLEGLGADLITVNPLMGRDAIEPFVSAARASGAGVLVLVRTSNPGAADIEDLELADGGTVWERTARLVEEFGRPGVGASGMSDVGAVVGATAPGHLDRARELMGAAVFLLPGIGAQGGRVEDLRAAFAPGPAGGLISASRSIAGAHLKHGGEPAEAAAAEAERLRGAAWRLSEGG
jgi:orotidine-5'-phosphate decarboxylase